MNTSRWSGRIEPEVRCGIRSTVAGWLSGLAMITLVSLPKRVSEAGSHQRLLGPGRSRGRGADHHRGAERLHLHVAGRVGPQRQPLGLAGGQLLGGRAALLPVPQMVVRSEAAVSPTLAMVTGVVWPPMSGQTQRAE